MTSGGAARARKSIIYRLFPGESMGLSTPQGNSQTCHFLDGNARDLMGQSSDIGYCWIEIGVKCSGKNM